MNERAGLLSYVRTSLSSRAGFSVHTLECAQKLVLSLRHSS